MVELVLRQGDLNGGVVPALGVAPEPAGHGDAPVADQHDVGPLRGDYRVDKSGCRCRGFLTFVK